MSNRIELKGSWQVAGAGKKVAVEIPGDVHSGLLAAGEIADPYWGTNELDLQHLHKEDWVFSRTFEVGAELLAAPSVYLHFDSIDTVAQVRVNGKEVGQSDNMFARQRFAIKQQLKKGINEIEVQIRSAENVAIERVAEMPYEIPSSDYPVQSPHRNLVRKVQCHAGWDWGCCLMAAGLYGEVYIAAAAPGRIEYVYTQQRHKKGACSVEVSVEVEAATAATTELVLRLDGQEHKKTVALKAGANALSETIEIKNPRIWWPAGYGEQPLYELTVEVAGDRVAKRLGLREVELVTEEDARGLGFKFCVNGLDIFAKGANWIPCDALPARQTRAALDELLTSAVEANMNMIRVWGGGRYEPVRPHHSWNAEHRVSNWLLINLQRHADHHTRPDRPFALLQTYPEAEAPQLPFGYPVMTAMALVPPLWRRVMDPRVAAWRRRHYPHISDWSAYDRLAVPAG